MNEMKRLGLHRSSELSRVSVGMLRSNMFHGTGRHMSDRSFGWIFDRIFEPLREQFDRTLSRKLESTLERLP
jgi:hypothetical protein